MSKEKTYWAPFFRGKVVEYVTDGGKVFPALYGTIEEASRFYKDVRKVKIVEVKKRRTSR